MAWGFSNVPEKSSSKCGYASLPVETLLHWLTVPSEPIFLLPDKRAA